MVSRKIVMLLFVLLLLPTLAIVCPARVSASSMLVADFTVPSIGTPVFATDPSPPYDPVVLESGVVYQIVAVTDWWWYAYDGSYPFDDPYNMNHIADAMYYTTGPISYATRFDWPNHYPDAFNGHSFLQINHNDVNWGPFNNGPTGHTYSIYYTGEGTTVEFNIHDWVDGDSNNNCHIRVQIYKELGNIVVKKVTNPSSDTTTSFSFVSSGPSFSQSFSLTGGGSHDSGLVPAGSGYSVSENVPSGWVLTSGICDNGNDPGSITVGAGQTVTCTFTNKKLTVPMGTSFSDTNGNPLTTDADGQPMVQIVAPGGKVSSTNPGAVVAIVDITNPGTTFSSSFQFSDTLPQDWTLLPEWKGKSSGNVKVCFYDASAFPLTGFPFSPNWTFECTGGVDITNQVSYAGTSSTVVSVNVPGSVLSALGGFGPGDHITVSMKMKFNPLKGSSLPTSYFSDGSNSAGVSFKAFTNSATASIGSFTGSSTGIFRGYSKNK